MVDWIILLKSSLPPPYDLEGLESEASIFPCPVDVLLGLDHRIFFSANRNVDRSDVLVLSQAVRKP